MGPNLLALAWLLRLVLTAVVAPPWAQEGAEPCGDWQEVRWPADGRCYRIFRQGPCPVTMEIAFRTDRREAECRCPPGKAQWSRDAKCHALYRRGPCQIGRYFAPVVNTRWGACLDIEKTCAKDELYWPKDEGQCYKRLTRGPCPIGELIIEEEKNSTLGVCRCDNGPELAKFRWITNTDACYEPYTRGPCGKGELVIPKPLRCGCLPDIPEYHNASGSCHQLGSLGPCPSGHQFVQRSDNSIAECECKEHHVLWPETGSCYREYTRGPCQAGMLLLPPTSGINNETQCASLPCPRGHLYFPEEQRCFRAGTQGLCPLGKLVVFEDFVGLSYRGRCGCSTKDFPSLAWDSGNECYEVGTRGACPRGHVFGPGGTCHALYTRGFCESPGQWLVPEGESSARCECRPGYGVGDAEEPCQAPLVALARFLSNTP
jgi:hypothetical protein